MTRPLIAIVGPTASGKTGIAIKLATKYDGEIISADSRTIYRNLDIGTAKPTLEEQRFVPHWGVDLVYPDERYSAIRFQKYTTTVIDEVRSRNHVPLLVGGTGLYVNSVVYNYSFAHVDMVRRTHLEEWSTTELKQHCEDNNIRLPENHQNKRHLVNQILRQGKTTKDTHSLGRDIYIVGITTDFVLLKQRIQVRALEMFNSEILEETSSAASLYGWDAPGLSGNIYRVIRQVLEGSLSRDEAVNQVATLDWQLAKRQLTWFKRDPNIKWLQLDEVEHYVGSILTIEH